MAKVSRLVANAAGAVIGFILLPSVASAEFGNQHSAEAIAKALTSPIPPQAIARAQDFDDRLMSSGVNRGDRVYLVTDGRSVKANTMVKKLLEAMGEDTRDWVVRVLDTEPPISNAFVAGGKYIYINTGLLNEATSDDELAFVIAHELGHSLLKHLLRREGDITSTIANIALLGAILSRKNREDFSNFAKITTASYSRGDEEEADAIAVAITQRAGYDPLRGIDFFSRTKRRQDDRKRKNEQDLAQMRQEVQQGQSTCQQLNQWYQSSQARQTRNNADRVNATCQAAESNRVRYNRLATQNELNIQQQQLDSFFSTHPEPQNRIAAIAALNDYVNRRRDLQSLSRYQQSHRVMVALNRVNSVLLKPRDLSAASRSVGGTSDRNKSVSPLAQGDQAGSLIVGKWRGVGDLTSVVSEIRRDGTLTMTFQGSEFAGGSASGFWKIQAGRFAGEITSSSIDGVSPGFAWSDAILELSSTNLVLRAESGVLEEYRRIGN